MTTEELNNEVVVVPYFMVYTADFKVIKEKLSDKQIVELFNAISDLCLYGETDFVAKNKFQAIWFEKLKKDFCKNLNKYKTCINNGKKGGRPKTEEKPTGFISDIPNKTQTKPKEKKRKEKNIIENNIIETITINSNKYGEFNNIILNEEQEKKLKELYSDKFNEAIEVLSAYIQSSGKKYKDFYAVLGKHNWVYKKVMSEKPKLLEGFNWSV